MEKLKVLIAIDDPNIAENTVKTASNFLEAASSEITLLNVLEITAAEKDFFYSKPEKFIELEARKSDFAFLEDFLESQGFEYKEFISKEGNAHEHIIKTAKEKGHDLVVVGSHNKHDLERLFLGSTSYNISKFCKSSVLVVKPSKKIESKDIYNVLFAVDGSDYSNRVIDNIDKYLDKNMVKLDLLYVSVPIEALIPADAYRYADMSKIEEEADNVGKEILKSAYSRLEEKGFSIKRADHLKGDAASTIIKETKERPYDLVVLGSRGKTNMPDFIIGSVSSKVAEHSPVPVLIVR